MKCYPPPQAWIPERHWCAPAGGEVDPDFANVVLLLHGDTGSGVTLVDSSGYAHVPSSSNVSSSATEKVFGPRSLRTLGAINSFTYVTQPEFIFGDTYTAEGWMFRDVLDNGGGPWSDWLGHNGSAGGAGRWFLATTVGDLTRPSVWINGNPLITGASGLIVAGGWQYFAWSVNAGFGEFYLSQPGGTTAARIASGAVPTDAAASDIYVGAVSGGGQGLSGYLDDVRLTKGVARYTGATIDVPTAAFPDSA